MQCRRIGLRHRLALDQLPLILGADILLRKDRLVHARLRKEGVIDLLVAVAAVTNEVDHYVPPKRLPEVHRELADTRHRVHVVTVDMQDRRSDALSDVGAVGSGTRGAGVRGEADLVVGDDVYAPP